MKHLFNIPSIAKVLACALFAAIASTPAGLAEPVAASDSKKKMEWRTDLDAALNNAVKNNKKVLLCFTANWCAPYRVMDARVWPDPTVQAELGKRYIIVKSDIDEEPRQLLSQKHVVRGVPSLLLLGSNGNEIARSGFMSSPETVKFLKTTGETATLP